MRKINKTMRTVNIVLVILAVIANCAYLWISYDFSLFIREGVTYSLVDFMYLTYKWQNAKSLVKLVATCITCLSIVSIMLKIAVNIDWEDEAQV